MTIRLRPTTRRVRRGLFESEDRRDFLVTLGFGLLIALLIVGLSYYDSNIRPLANVGGVDISPALVRERTALVQERLIRDEGRLRTLRNSNEIDVATLNAKLQELNTEGEQMTVDSVTEELIDLIFQRQLAAGEAVTPSEADIDAALAREFALPERRHILLVRVTPEKTGTARPTVAQRQAAIDRANQALAQLNGGADWATVAAQFSDDPGAGSGGDGGWISSNNPTDAGWTDAVFDLQQGATTRVVGSLGCARADGGECYYRIGRLVEVQAGGEDTAYRDKLLTRVGEPRVREIVGWELTADRLRDKITAAATTGALDQVHLSQIVIRDTEDDDEEPEEGSPAPSPSADPAAQGEVNFSQILYAPNDEPDDAPDVPAEDPAWTKAKTDADTAFAELNAITDATARATRFADIAKAQSDDEASKAEGGEIDFSTRDLLPDEVGKALFDTPHAAGDLLGPVKDEFGWYVLLFHERRGTPQERLQALKNDIAAGVDWNTLVDKYSDAEDAEKAEHGDIGWYTREMLSQVEKETVDKLFALQTGQVGEPITFGTDSLIFKALEHTSRELDPNQMVQLTDPEFGVFSTWYSDKKEEAETKRVITRPGDEPLPVETPTDEP